MMVPARARPRPLSPVRLIWPSDMWPVMTAAIEPRSGMISSPTSDETSDTIASVFVLAAAYAP